MDRKKKILGYFMVIASAVVFGCMPLMVKRIYADGVNSLSVVFLRNLLSVPVVGLLALGQRKNLKIPRAALPSVAAIGIAGCCLAPVLLFSSYHFMASGTATILHFVYPAAVVLGGFLFYREKVTLSSLISVVVCIGGMCLFYSPGDPLPWQGTVLAVVSGFAYAAYIVLLSHFRFREEVSGFVLNFYIFIINSLVMFLVCLAGGMLTFPTTLGGWATCALIALAVNAGAVALFQRGTMIVGGQQAAILSTMEPITSVFVGILVFQETMTVRTALGSVLVLLASVLIVASGSGEK